MIALAISHRLPLIFLFSSTSFLESNPVTLSISSLIDSSAILRSSNRKNTLKGIRNRRIAIRIFTKSVISKIFSLNVAMIKSVATKPLIVDKVSDLALIVLHNEFNALLNISFFVSIEYFLSSSTFYILSKNRLLGDKSSNVQER